LKEKCSKGKKRKAYLGWLTRVSPFCTEKETGKPTYERGKILSYAPPGGKRKEKHEGIRRNKEKERRRDT